MTYKLCALSLSLIAARATSLDAEIETLLTENPGNSGSATIEWTVFADGTDASVASGNSVPTTWRVVAITSFPSRMEGKGAISGRLV